MGSQKDGFPSLFPHPTTTKYQSMLIFLIAILSIIGITLASLAPLAIAYESGSKKEQKRLLSLASSHPLEFDVWILENRIQSSSSQIEELKKSLS